MSQQTTKSSGAVLGMLSVEALIKTTMLKGKCAANTRMHCCCSMPTVLQVLGLNIQDSLMLVQLSFSLCSAKGVNQIRILKRINTVCVNV
jgi:hypothetical protein